MESNHPARGRATGWRGLRGASGVRFQEPGFLNPLENLGAPPEVARRRELGVTAVVLLEQWRHKCGNWRRGLTVPSQTLRTDGSRTGAGPGNESIRETRGRPGSGGGTARDVLETGFVAYLMPVIILFDPYQARDAMEWI